MSNSTDAILQEAFELIENNELAQAREKLTPLLESESNNPAVWWVYAHAIEDPEEGKQALNKVVQLDPTYPGANEILSQATPSEILPVAEPADASVDDWDDLSFDPDRQGAEAVTTGGSRSPVRFLLVAVVVIIIVVGIFGLLSGVFGGSSTPPTAVAGQTTEIPTLDTQIVTNISATEAAAETEVATPMPTDEPDEATESPTTDEPTTEPTEIIPTDEPTAEPTELIPTDEPTDVVDQSISILVSELSGYNITEGDIETRTTLIGETMDITVCALLGAESSLALNGVMDVFVEQYENLPENVEAVAVSLLDCSNDEAMTRTIGVERAHIEALANDEIELKDFQRQWQPLP